MSICSSWGKRLFIALTIPTLIACLPLRSLAQPPMTIDREAPDLVVLTWTNRLYHLEQASTLDGPESWSSVTETPTEVDGRLLLRFQATQDASYFRLRKTPGGLPPDPATIAPPLPSNRATSFAEATSFLFSGPDPVQTGVTPGTIVAGRACVARGSVRDPAGGPVPGVTVRVMNHPEFGRTLTRSDGRFDLAVNGGGPVVIQFEKTGLLPLQRQVPSRWQDYVAVPEVVMVPVDSWVTPVTLGPGAPLQVARGSAQLDIDGARQATLLLPSGTSASLVRPDGSLVTTDTLHVRATEYTVGTHGPAAMPATLPANIGYTYCVEFSADEAIESGAREVRFDRTLSFYVENFIGFPVGTPVPTGYYDRNRATWIPSANGRVVRLAGISDGLAGLDVDGDGSADSTETLAALGVTDEERSRLALLYADGTELWRVPIAHFTPWDCNWPYGPPAGAITPGSPLPPGKPAGEVPTPDKDCGSLIEIQNQVLIETVPVAGTPFTLNYRSDRVPGREDLRTLDIAVSGSTVPSTVKRIELSIEIAGRTFASRFSPEPNQRWRFVWDRMDAYGRAVTGPQPAIIRVGYVYGAVYQTRTEQEFAFGQFADTPLTVARNALEVIVWNESTQSLEGYPADAAGLGSWTLSVHHAYAPATQTLYLGDGGRRSASGASAMVLSTVAGGGPWPPGTGDDGPATSAYTDPYGLAVGPDGSVYIADYVRDVNNNGVAVVRRVGPDGIIRRYAGSGESGVGVDEGPATNALFNSVEALALGPDGTLFIDEQFMIHRVTPDGMVSTVMGDRRIGFTPDGRLTSPGKIGWVYFLAVASDGSLYFDEIDDARRLYLIRRISPDGVLRTVAGAGNGAGWGESVYPASKARFPDTGIFLGTGGAIGPDDTLYVAAGSIIRRLGADGIMSPVTDMIGQSSPGGDGGPALNATLGKVRALAVGRDGSLFVGTWNSAFSQEGGFAVRQVGTDGIIRTVAGNGNDGGAADGPATQSAVFTRALAVGPEGSMFIASRNFVQRLSRLGARQEAAEVWLPAEDGREIFVFDASGRHLRTVDGLTGGTRLRFSYGDDGGLASVFNAADEPTTLQRNAANRTLTIVAPHEQRTELAFNLEGYLAQVTPAGGVPIPFAYDHGGLLTQRTDALTNVHTYAYDAQGRLVLDQGPEGGFRRLTRTDAGTSFTVTVSTATGTTNAYTIEGLATGGQRRTRTDPAGLKWELTEGTDGSFVHRSPDGTVVKGVEGRDPIWGMAAPVIQSATLSTPGLLTYSITSRSQAGLVNPGGDYPLGFTNLSHIVTLNGRSYTNNFEPVSRIMTHATPAGRRTAFTLTPAGDVARMATPGLNPTELQRDPQGRVREVVVGDGNGDRRWTFDYNAAGQVSRWVYPDGKAVDTLYNAEGRATNRVFADGRQVQYTYDPAGNALSVTPPGREAHHFTYSATDLITAYQPPRAPEVRFEHDLDGRLIRFTRGDGQLLAFDFGDSDCRCGRLLSVTGPEGTTSYTYSPVDGHLSSILTPGGAALGYGYDGALMTTETWSGEVAGQVSRVYDNDFRVASRTVNGADPVSVLRDKDGLLTRSGDLILTRDPNHGLVAGTSLQNVTDERHYNQFGEMEEYTAAYQGTPRLQWVWIHDLVGQIVRRTETLEGATVIYDYAYDAAGRLAEVQKDGIVVEAYTYDANGNRLTAAGTTTATAGYDEDDALTTLTTSQDTTSFSYNGNLELTSRVTGTQTTRYTHNALGHLAQVILPDGTEISYAIDGRGRRVGKRRDGLLVQGFLFQDQWRPIAELDAANTVVSRFIYATDAHVPDYLTRGGVTYRLLKDQVGSVRLVVNAATGEVAQRLDYDSFGRVLEDTNPGFQPFGFAGGLYDRDTALVHFGVREYDPATGRWISRDPVLLGGQQLNFFAYAGGDPVNRADPSGLVSIEATGYAGAGGGLKVAVDSEGISICGEVGLGLGAGVSVDPRESIDGDSTSIIAEVSLEKGPLSVSVKGELDDCGRASGEGKGCFGPFCGKAKKTLGKEGVEVGGEVGGSDLLGKVTELLKEAIKGANTKLQGKIAAKQCVQHKW